MNSTKADQQSGTQTENEDKKLPPVTVIFGPADSARWPRPLVLGVLLAIIFAAGYFTAHLRQQFLAQHAPHSDSAWTGTPLRSGPWGKLSSVPIWISAPDEYLSVRLLETNHYPWLFKNYSPGQLKVLFSKIDLTREQSQDLFDSAKWQTSSNGVVVQPTRQTLYSLSPSARGEIYSVLARWPENARQHAYLSFPDDGLKEQFDHSGVSKETMELFKSLCYSRGHRIYFADFPLVLASLTDYDEKLRFLKAVTRTPTMLVKILINPESDVDQLVSYWGRAGNGKDIRPLLESLQRVPSGVRVSISRLFPPWPTARLYNFPNPSLPPPAGPVPQDCHWTSFNFFQDPPDDRFSDTRNISVELKSDYYPVLSDPRYGDLVFLLMPSGDLIHSAVFIADNVVYSKNGSSFLQPWILSTIPELVDRYSFLSPKEPLRVVYYRNKYF